MRRLLLVLPWVLLLAVTGGFLYWQKAQTPKAPVTIDGVKLPAEKHEPLIDTSRTGGVISYHQAVKVAAPAVVSIFTELHDPLKERTAHLTEQQRQELERFLQENGDMFDQPFGDNESLGSGVIVRPDGYILTNNHVIEDAKEIVVALHDGRKVKAQVIGTDPESDLAVIKVNLTNLPVLPFKLSGNEVGDVVLAIGNPFGVGQTVTQGIISALGRSGLGINIYEDFIQTDAAINPGNSGGALIDVSGNLIGVNTAIFSQVDGGATGIGFAIPASVCKHVLDSILQHGRVVRGWIGIQIAFNSVSDMATSRPKGIEIAEIFADSPAMQAGLKQGDRITVINGTEITNESQLMNIVAALVPNTTANFTVLRGDQELTLPVHIAERQPEQLRSPLDKLPKPDINPKH